MKHANWVFFSQSLPRPRWPLWLLWLLLLSWPAQASVVRVNAAEAVLQPDGGQSIHAEVNLPHRWDRAFPGRGGRATYRFSAPPPLPGQPRALYIPRVGNQVEIRVAGHLLYRAGRLGDTSSDFAKAPVWELIPPSIDLPGVPLSVEVELSAQASRWGGLSAPVIGPEAEVHALYVSHYRWRQYGGLAVSIGMGLMAFVAGVLWLLQREPLYGVFALGAAAGALRFGDRLIEQPPLPWPLWGGLMAVALLLHLLMMARFSLMLLNAESTRTRRFLLTALTLQSTAGLWAFLAARPMVWTITLATLALPSALALSLTVHAAWRQRTPYAYVVLGAGLLVTAAGFRDWAMVRVSGDGSSTFSILPHAAMLYVLLLGWVVVHRYASIAREHRELLTTLDARVRARESELAESNARLRDEHARQAALEERQRLMRDIHDGVGAQLVGLLSLLDREGQPRAVLRAQASSALDELRMAVDALQPVHGDLATVLATLRYRLQPRLEAAGIGVDWRVDALPPIDGLTPPVVLQLQRILLETFTNVIRHARADRLRVSANFNAGPPEQLVLRVEDNGVGLGTGGAEGGHGHGLGNMRVRAAAIGAQLRLEPAEHGGTVMHLSLPVQRSRGNLQ